MKNKELQNLLKQIIKFQNSEPSDDLLDKIHGEIFPAALVEVYWFDRPEADKGYLFALPGQEIDEGDVCVHIPQMDNSDGIGEGESIHCHLSNILTNKRVKWVVLKGGLAI